MNLAEQMLAKTKQVEDRDKLDIIFNKYVLPRIEKVVENKGREVSFSSFSRNKEDDEVKELIGIHTLQDLVGTKMKPYLQELGFKVVLCNPAYYTYIRW